MSKKRPAPEPKVCSCNPDIVASRGLCDVHGFVADPALMHKHEARKKAQAMSMPELIDRVIDLAEVGLESFDLVAEDETRDRYTEKEKIEMGYVIEALRSKVDR